MTKTHNIQIEGLPDGWKPVAFRVPENGEYFLLNGVVRMWGVGFNPTHECLIFEKIKPRRIVLEETEENSDVIQQYFEPGFSTNLKKKWKLIKEGE